MNFPFVNRIKEIRTLNARTEQIGKSRSIVLLNGISGVGKSSLAETFVLRWNESHPAIKVRLNRADRNTYTNGYFINKTASTLNDHAKSDNRLLTFEQFLRQNKPSEIVLTKFAKSLKEDFASNVPGGYSIRTLFDLITGQDEFDEESVFQSTNSEPQTLVANYLASESKRQPLIINIENIQAADAISMRFLSDISKECNNCLFLLEYTEGDKSGLSITEVIEYFADQDTEIGVLNVEPLHLSDVKKILDEHPEVSWELIQQSFVQWEGNLRPLVDILSRLKYNISDTPLMPTDVNGATKEHLMSLSVNERFVLNVLYWHNEPAPKSLLLGLSNFKAAKHLLFDVNHIVDSLIEKSLVGIEAGRVSIAHDTISTELTGLADFTVHTLLAQKYWYGTYNTFLEGRSDLYMSKGFVLSKVLSYASHLEDTDRIYELLDLISYECLRSREPERMLEYVAQTKNALLQKQHLGSSNRVRLINVWLIELWYKLGRAKSAFQVLQESPDLGRTGIVLNAILLEQVGKHSEAIQYCETHIPIAKTINEELALRLVKLVTNFDIGNSAEAEKEFNFLYRNERFTKCFEYGFLLRNAELVFSFRDSLPYYKESIAVFKEYKAARQAAFSRITYGVHLGLTGNYKKARKQFHKANIELGDVVTERHTLFNNLAVLHIMQKSNLREAESLLRQALSTATGDFERLAINMNFLAILDWEDRMSEADRVIDTMIRIIDNRSFASTEILLFAYYNILKFYERIEDMSKVEFYVSVMHDIGIPNDALWNKWFRGCPEIPIEDELHFTGSIDRATSFLCNWNMEYDSSLMRYE
ncbi:MAG: ATP-binding protein [Flavobacteriales bacterium]|nr:ATP-binding protein [Flavobacteriales bacterium]